MFSFPDVPGFVTGLEFLLEGNIPDIFAVIPGLLPIILVYRVITPKYLQYRIERDLAGDGRSWRVTLELAEEPEREESGTIVRGDVQPAVSGHVRQRGIGVLPAATILALGVAISFVLVGGAVAYRITKGDWGPAGVLAWGPILLGAGGALVFFSLSGRAGGYSSAGGMKTNGDATTPEQRTTASRSCFAWRRCPCVLQ
jgi:hypothetical protein